MRKTVAAKRPLSRSSKLAPASRATIESRWRTGAITRKARAAGKDPKRVYAGLKGAATRALNARLAASKHGQRAREKTERALTAAQKGARTRAAKTIERELTERPLPSRAPLRSISLDELDGYDGDAVEIDGGGNYGGE